MTWFWFLVWPAVVTGIAIIVVLATIVGSVLLAREAARGRLRAGRGQFGRWS